MSGQNKCNTCIEMKYSMFACGFCPICSGLARTVDRLAAGRPPLLARRRIEDLSLHGTNVPDIIGCCWPCVSVCIP
jgi:hypothetical protein